jgi:dipeptidase
VYAGSTKIPKEMENMDSTNNTKSAWWIFKNIQNIGTKYFEKVSPLANNFWLANHSQIVAKQKRVEKKVLEHFKSGNKQKGINLLNTFTYAQATTTLYHARRLLKLVSTVNNEK